MQRTEEYHLSHTSYGPKSLKYLKHIRRALFITFTRFEDIAPAGLCVLHSGKQTVQHEDKALKPIFFFFPALWHFCEPVLLPSLASPPVSDTLEIHLRKLFHLYPWPVLSLWPMNPLQPLAAQMAEEEDYDWVYNHAVRELAELRGGWIKKAHGSGWNCKT